MSKLYIIDVQYGGYPAINGPYESEEVRLEESKKIRQQRDIEGVFKLNVSSDGTPFIAEFPET